MKAKFYIGILSAMILSVLPVKAQYADSRDYRGGEAGIVINNYYDNYDYYYTSRINRFHRSYAVFDYYSPVFTDTYWYTFQPFSWGISIYGGSRFGFRYAVNYPVYYSGWGYNDWYDPYYGSSWYNGYDPYYNSWYSPVMININIGNWWRHNHLWRNNYWGWNRNHYYWHNDYRPFYNTYNYHNSYYASGYSSGDYVDRDRSREYNRTTPGVQSRREGSVPSGPAIDRKNERVNQSANPSGNPRSNRTNATNPSRTQAGTRSPNVQRRNLPEYSAGRTQRTASATVSRPSPSGGATVSQSRSSAPSRTTTMSQSRSSSPSRSATMSQSRSSSVSRGSAVSPSRSSTNSRTATMSQSRSSSSSRGATMSQTRSSSQSRGATMSQSRSSSSRSVSKSSGTTSRSSSKSSDSSQGSRRR